MELKEKKVRKTKKTAVVGKTKGVYKSTDKAKTATTAKVKKPAKKEHFQVVANKEAKAMMIEKAKAYTKGNLSAIVRYATVNFNPTAKQKKEMEMLS